LAIDLNQKDLVQALHSIVVTPAVWKNRGANGRAAVEEQFRIARVANLMTTAFEDVIKGRKSPECRWDVPAI